MALTYVYVLHYEDLTGMGSVQGVYTTREKAEASRNEMLAEEFEGEAMYSPEDFNIESFILD
jgi:hypothetical protein